MAECTLLSRIFLSRFGIGCAVDAFTICVPFRLVEVKAIANDRSGVINAGAAVRVPPVHHPCVATVVLPGDLKRT